MSAAEVFPRALARPDEPNAFKFGKILDEPIEVYHGCGALSKTKLDVFRDSPRLFKKRFITKELPPEKSEALLLGGAIDALSLEGPESFRARYICVPEDAPKRPTKKQREAKKPSPATLEAIAFWDKFSAEAEGKEILTDTQAALAQRCADALHGNKQFARFVQLGKPQITFRVPGRHFAMQCRPDLWCEDGTDLTEGMPAIVDVKSIAELPADDPEHLPRHIGTFGYHRAAYIYRELVSTVMKYREGYRPPFILALVEKREPHSVFVRPIDDIAIEIGEREVAESVERLKKCLAEDYWPESWDPPLTPVGLSSYYVRRALEHTESNLWG